MGTYRRSFTIHHSYGIIYHYENHSRSMYWNVHITSSNDNIWDFTNINFRIHWSFHSNILLNWNNNCLLVLLHLISIIQCITSIRDLALCLWSSIDYSQHPNNNLIIRLPLRNTKILPPPSSKNKSSRINHLAIQTRICRYNPSREDERLKWSLRKIKVKGKEDPCTNKSNRKLKYPKHSNPISNPQ